MAATIKDANDALLSLVTLLGIGMYAEDPDTQKLAQANKVFLAPAPVLAITYDTSIRRWIVYAYPHKQTIWEGLSSTTMSKLVERLKAFKQGALYERNFNRKRTA